MSLGSVYISHGSGHRSTKTPLKKYLSIYVFPNKRKVVAILSRKITHQFVITFSAYNDKVVAFLRQPNILDILKERHPAFTSNSTLRQKVVMIRNDGVDALERLSNDIELIILLR